jgi:fatty acid desaturase
MQTYAEATLSDQDGRDLWLSMFHDVKFQELTAPSLARALTKLVLLFGLFAGALWLSWHETSWFVLTIAYVALAMLLAQFAFVGHDAGHGSISRNPFVNRIFGQLSMTLFTGLAFDEWIKRHRTHHQFCQDEAKDPDMAVTFAASLTEESARGKTVLGRFMTRHQAVLIWMLSFFFGHSQRHLSQAVVLRNPLLYRVDAIALLAHFALWFGVPCFLLGVPFYAALLTYLLPLTLLGPYLAAIFWVNHIGMPLIRKVESFSFFEHQIVTSRSITNPPAWDWFFGGLNFQIEHHLFPQIPSNRLPEVQTIVQEHFVRHRIEYHGVTWWQAIGLIAVHLRRVAQIA